MRNDLTELIFILDMSGSMCDLKADTIGGYNSLLEAQKEAEGDANVTTVLFDDRYIVLHDRADIQTVAPITEKEYQPCGMTAMLDAIGKTFHSVGQKLAEMPEEERPGNVIVTIITDGYENASQEFTWDTIHDMIKEQREKYSWTITFIGANVNVEQMSDQLGIDRKLAKSYTANSIGTASVYQTMSKSMSKYRASSARISCGICGMSMRSNLEDEMAKDMEEIE